MTLDDYAEELRRDVWHFVAMWQRGMRDEPEAFPEEMPPGQWGEQFRAFQDFTIRHTSAPQHRGIHQTTTPQAVEDRV